MANLIGQRVGQYAITARLGTGGMATVYQARQESMGRDVAIKVIKPDLAEMGDFVARFEREAHTVASLSHPHILKVFDYGHQDDLLYLVMELIKGGSLANLIRRGPIPLDRVSHILEQVGSALDYAHRRGIIYRDLKPHNILLDDESNALLTDFGVAKILSETTGLTQSGVAMGTPSYMSPEQWHGQALDSRADVYALGIMSFEMLTSTLPFVADTPPTLMYKHLQEPPPSILERRADLPPEVQGVIQKALAKNRDQRFSSAGDLANAIKAALTGQVPIPEDLTSPQPLDTKGQAPTAVRSPGQEEGATERLTAHGGSRVWIFGIVIGLLVVVGISAVLLSGRATPTPTILPPATTQSPTSSPVTVAQSSTPVPTPVQPQNVSATTGTIVDYPSQGQDHIAEGSAHPAYNSNPPTSGWHYDTPADWGIYDQVLPDETLVHNLEHGGIWISYRDPDDTTTITALKTIANGFKDHVILTPRPANDSLIAVAAWGHLLKLDKVDTQAIIDFISQYIYKGPENV